MEKKLIQLTPVVRKDEHILPTSLAVNRIAKALNSKEIYYKSTKSIYLEIRSMVEGTLVKGHALKASNGRAPEPKSRSRNGQLTHELLKTYHFHYMGNRLEEVVPDLKEVLEE
jgi:hypothetical protein